MKPHGGLILLTLLMLDISSAEQCGSQANNAACPNGLCCSNFGWCGSTNDYCGAGKCQSQCPGAGPSTPVTPAGDGGGVASIITRAIFDEMLKHQNSEGCPAKGFYSYDAFISAAKFFPEFGTTGDLDTRKRELAAFFGQTSHETTGGWANAPDGPYAWGYCFVKENNAVERYAGRGPIQLTGESNYRLAGDAIREDLISNPDLVATNPIISFKTAIWFWMAPQYNKPSCHDVVIGRWTPSAADREANRVPGYGVITNIINGGVECGKGPYDKVADRIGFYKRYCDMLAVSYGGNLDCYNQMHF